MARSARATKCAASPSSTSWESTRAPRARSRSATTRARSPISIGEPESRARIHVHHDERRAPAVGLEGYAVAERAFQRAAEWARTRVQGKPPVAAASGPAPIINHPDVKRMLLTMKSGVEAMRALAMYAAFQLDLAEHDRGRAQRAAAHTRAELLIPIVKGWCTELGNELTHIGIQVHGGMGFIEETGAAQYARDVRITTIYEGTTGIQANDLIGRKIGRDRRRGARRADR